MTADDVSYPNSDENTNTETNTKTETNKGLTNDSYDVIYFYRTRVRSLFTLVTNSLTNSVTHPVLFSSSI